MATAFATATAAAEAKESVNKAKNALLAAHAQADAGTPEHLGKNEAERNASLEQLLGPQVDAMRQAEASAKRAKEQLDLASERVEEKRALLRVLELLAGVSPHGGH